MSDALAKVKTDLGRGAVILHTRTIKHGGVFGIGARSLVEITATADPRVSVATGGGDGQGAARVAPRPRPTANPPQPAASPVPVPARRGRPGPCAPPADDPIHRPPARSRERKAPAAGARARLDSDPVLRSEVKEIRAMVKDLLRRDGRTRRPQMPADLLDHYTRLVGQDVADELAAQLLDRVTRNLQERGAVWWDDHGRLIGAEGASPAGIREELQKAVVELVPSAQPLRLTIQDRPTIVAMVGPTGVGKTTTIAKLAANMKLREGKRVGLVTIDTYRIAAVEQLKTYAEILQVPLVAVTTPEEMRPAIHEMSEVDLILIDTAGRSQKDEMRIAELRRFLTAARPDEVHLVLSCTSREEAIRESITNFSSLGPRHLIFTKLDEAVGFGVILNVLRSVDMHLSYLTNGQSVPADIEAGSARRVAELVLGSGAEAISMAGESPPSPGVAVAKGRGN